MSGHAMNFGMALERETLASDIPDEPTLRWDGHSTEEKYRRLDVWSRALAAR